MLKVFVKDKEYPCEVTNGALLRFKHMTGREFTTLQEGEISECITFLWCCVVSASKAADIEFPLSLEDFADATKPEQLNEFIDHLMTSDAEKKTAGSQSA